MAVSVLAALALLTACADDAAEAPPPSPVTVTVTTQATVVSSPTDEPQGGASAAEPDGSASAPASDADGIVVPDVVGINHQKAQDTMQAAGLYHLDEEDATGQGRLLLWDRNWVVVSQSPPAGSRVASDTTIVLRSKKYSD